jgi:hypothetical protein
MQALAVVEAAFNYLRQNPEELVRILRNATSFRFGLPLAALRWAAGKAQGKRAPKDIEIAAIPPGLRIGASLELMGTPLRAAADIFIERIDVTPEQLRLDVRLSGVSLKVLDDRIESPLAALLKSGALDLSKPGNLVAYMPRRPAILVEARDDRLVLDLMRLPKLANDPRIKRLVSVLVPLVTIQRIETESDHVDVALKPLPGGLSRAFEEVRRAL